MVHEVLRYSDVLAMLHSQDVTATCLENKIALQHCLFIQDGAVIVDFMQQQFPSFSLLFDVLPKSIKLIDDMNPRIVARSPAYLAMRDQVWEESKARLGDGLWNGTLLTVVRMSMHWDVLTIFVRECEYKDIMLKRKYGSAILQEKLPLDTVTDAYFHTCTVPWIAHRTSLMIDNVPFTRNGMKSAVIGRIGRGTINEHGTLSFIGGTLNTDEFSIRTFEDVKAVSVQELYEEAHIVGVDAAHLQLMSMNYRQDRSSLHTLFSTLVAEQCIKNFSSNDELSDVFLYSEQQLLATQEALAFNITCFLKCLPML